MVRTPSYDKYGLKKGTWTPEEDKKLSDYVTKYGYRNWRQLPKHAGLARCGKSCRLRWMNYLRPDIKRGNYNKEEEDTIIRLHDKLGNSWSAIAAQLPGRMDNEIKNHWHSYLKKKVIPKTTSSETNPDDNLSQEPQMDFSSIPTDCNLMVEDFSETLDDFWSEQLLLESPLMLDNDFPSVGLSSPVHSTALFDGEQLGQYDDLFSSI